MESINLVAIIPSTPERVFRAWLDAEEHAAFTGYPVTASPDGRFTAGAGYIEGRTLASEPGRRILQAWRTSEFPSDSEDSLLEVLLQGVEEGTRLTLSHWRIPDGQGKPYTEGWESYYLETLKRYFAPKARKAVTKKASRKASRTGSIKRKLAKGKGAARENTQEKRETHAPQTCEGDLEATLASPGIADPPPATFSRPCVFVDAGRRLATPPYPGVPHTQRLPANSPMSWRRLPPG